MGHYHFGYFFNPSREEYGEELLPTGNFTSQADFDSWTSTSVVQVYEWGGAVEQTLLRTTGDGDPSASFVYALTGLEIGASYEFTADIDPDFTLNPRYWTNGETNLQNPPDALLGEKLVWVCTQVNQSVGIGHGNSLFTLNSISLRKRLDIPIQ